jgi:L-iditol 2-dehydrogenase
MSNEERELNNDTIIATAAYVQQPYRVSYRQVPLRAPAITEAIVDVVACGVCGHDLEIAGGLAAEPRPLGHEVVGIVREVGAAVTHVRPGDQIVLESNSFCGDCDLCRNGRVDLCQSAPKFGAEPVMGFSDVMLTPGRAIVPAPNIDPLAAVLAEPCGVAIDMIRVAEIGLTDRVLVVGAGCIGLMALAIARHRTMGTVVAADRLASRLEVAQRLGADAVVDTSEASLSECGQAYGGFDRILVTAPPRVLPDCLTAAARGGYVVFIGFDWGEGGVIPLDTTAMHVGKKQLRPSFASPALYLPEALHLLRTGVVPAEELVTHRFPLSRLEAALRTAREDTETARKVLVIPDRRYQG